jgi:hypothetical protein
MATELFEHHNINTQSCPTLSRRTSRYLSLSDPVQETVLLSDQVQESPFFVRYLVWVEPASLANQQVKAPPKPIHLFCIAQSRTVREQPSILLKSIGFSHFALSIFAFRTKHFRVFAQRHFAFDVCHKAISKHERPS